MDDNNDINVDEIFYQYHAKQYVAITHVGAIPGRP